MAKGLLPDNYLIMGSARREPTVEDWKKSLGDYPEEFLWHLDYQMSDLSMVDTLRHLPDYVNDITYFLSHRQKNMRMLSSSQRSGMSRRPRPSRVVNEKPFGHDYKSAYHLQSVVERHLREKQVYRIDHYLGKDTVNNILATRFSNILLNHFGTVST